ncbi:rhodanese-like domain-containing protein [Actinomadura mexicana]|uniref:3-mercaptopyruvate sulfurtransferase SseA, contains two rhodanese domains n=1 Tax=Actinomadura mexicana TaxID=134959 RepID=A0A238XCQ7_9ACTN|nr:rhodanese-like domain-containing protein [Actinomadura mexicana]SNR56283.1 3-mercaptopyruvate sulfurtransferase SseA, contains two rhodanese domains [Actinomadura mexicana]
MTGEDHTAFISFDEIERWRATGKVHGLLDVRERGEYALGQIPGSCPLPRGLIEICLERMVPWKDVPLVLYSNAEHRSVLAARTCLRLGYRDVRVLAGGIQQWSANGRSPAYGVNVIGKTFGEKLSVTDEVQQLTPDEVAVLAEAGNTLIFDARTASEYAKGHIPGAYNVPGGQLVPTVFDAGIEQTDRSAPIIVHCAGRTRSIVGAYLLRQAGFENVFALRNGTMAWVMSGRELDREPRPWTGPRADAQGPARSAKFAHEFVRGTHAYPISECELPAPGEFHRPCYLIDVRMVDEFTAGHIPSALSCPAGQLANAVDEQLAARDALLVCYSGSETRAKIGAGLLARIGYRRVAWLTGGLSAWGGPIETGGPNAYLDDLSFSRPGVQTIDGAELADVLRDGTGTLLDVRRSSEYALSHIPGSVWIPRGDLERRIDAHAAPGTRLIVASDRELRSTLAARTLLDLGHRNVSVLEGGINGWICAGRPTEEGLDGADVSLAEAKEDAELVARRPKLLERNRDDMVRYLDWEERLGTRKQANAESKTGASAGPGGDHGRA